MNTTVTNDNEKRRTRPYYCMDNTNYFLNYGTIRYIIDKDDWEEIYSLEKSFRLLKVNVYPSYKYNNKDITLLEFIFKFNREENIYYFKNSNNCDLRKENVLCYPKIYSNIMNTYTIVDFIQGHYSTVGQSAYKIKNCLWKIKENEKLYYLMYCEKETLCKLSEESYNKVTEYEKTIGKKLTWYKCANGYIQTHNPSDGKNYYIHQIIMNCYGNGQGTKNVSVDHIDRDTLNNRLENLRIATRAEQEQNSKCIMTNTKRARKHNAKPLPEGITQDMMRKYVGYYHEYLDKEETKSREYFKIEKHPKLGKIWIGTKSNKIPIMEKLRLINKVVDDLAQDIYPEKNDIGLPTYVTIKNERDKFHMVFDKKDDEKRFNLRMVLPENYNLEEQLGIFREKVKTKYEIEI